MERERDVRGVCVLALVVVVSTGASASQEGRGGGRSSAGGGGDRAREVGPRRRPAFSSTYGSALPARTLTRSRARGIHSSCLHALPSTEGGNRLG